MTFYVDEATKELFLSCKELKEPNISLIEVQNDDALKEKHIPKVEILNDQVKVKIGDIMHPMTSEHYISIIFLETNLGGQFKHLTYTNKPVVDFILSKNEYPKAVYEYCTLHGLWKLDIE